MAVKVERSSIDGGSDGREFEADRRHSLERRLEDGYQRIDEAVLAGADVTEWESFWLRLLREYEDVCREFDAAA